MDHDRNIAYGFNKKDGRLALYSVALDGSLQEALVYSNPDVDVDEVITVGRRQRVVGVSFATDVRHAVYFDPDVDRLMRSLSKALPKQPALTVVHVREGSPARHADKIKVPVLMFHGTLDRNVSVNQSRTMDARLEKAGVKHQLVTFEGLDHNLEDSQARTEMLRKSDEFLQATIAGAQTAFTPPGPAP